MAFKPVSPGLVIESSRQPTNRSAARNAHSKPGHAHKGEIAQN